MNAELPPSKNEGHNSESPFTIDRVITPLKPLVSVGAGIPPLKNPPLCLLDWGELPLFLVSTGSCPPLKEYGVFCRIEDYVSSSCSATSDCSSCSYCHALQQQNLIGE